MCPLTCLRGAGSRDSFLFGVFGVRGAQGVSETVWSFSALGVVLTNSWSVAVFLLVTSEELSILHVVEQFVPMV